jgi:hypothetical protein
MIAFIGDVHRAFNRLAGAVASLTPDVEVERVSLKIKKNVAG